MHILYDKSTIERIRLARLFLALIQVLATVMLAACGTLGASKARQASPLKAASSTSGSVPQSGQGQTFQISIVDDNFKPAELTVPVGATVVWTEVGHDQHTVTADDQSFKSSTMNNGSTFKYVFTKVGTYRYYCEFHGYKGSIGMSGTITVVSSSGSSTSPSEADLFIIAGHDRSFAYEKGGPPTAR